MITIGDIEYIAPEIDINAVSVEAGFTTSYGDEGEAGDYFDVNDNGIY